MIKKYFESSFTLGVTTVIISLKGFILIPILTKTYGAVNYGIWAQVAVLVAMATPIIVSGTDSALIILVPGKGKEYARKAFSTQLVYILGVSIIFALFFVLFSQQISSILLGGSGNFLFIALVGYVITSSVMVTLCQLWYRIQDTVKYYNLTIIVQAFYGTIIAFCVAVFHGDIFLLIVISASADALMAIFLLLHIQKMWGFERPDYSILISLLKFGIPIIPVAYSMWVLNASDRLFIAYYATIADVGVYTLVYALGYVLISFFFNPIFLMYPPKAAELYTQKNFDDLTRLFNYSTKAALGLMVPSIVGLSLLANPLLYYLAAPEFVRGASLVPFISLGYTFSMLSSYFSISLCLVHKQIYTSYTLLFAAGCNIIMNFILIPPLGILGAAISTCISFGIQIIFEIWLGSRYIPLRFDWVFLGKAVFASAVMGFIILLIHPENIVTLLAMVILGIAIYFSMMILIRAVKTEELEAIFEILHLKSLERYPPFKSLFTLIKRV
jgi:O-antigen/teichoic acid export membrane protein